MQKRWVQPPTFCTKSWKQSTILFFLRLASHGSFKHKAWELHERPRKINYVQPFMEPLKTKLEGSMRCQAKLFLLNLQLLMPKNRGRVKRFFAQPLMVPPSMKLESSTKCLTQIVLLNLQLLVPKVGGQAKQLAFNLSWSSQIRAWGIYERPSIKKKCLATPQEQLNMPIIK